MAGCCVGWCLCLRPSIQVVVEVGGDCDGSLMEAGAD